MEQPVHFSASTWVERFIKPVLTWTIACCGQALLAGQKGELSQVLLLMAAFFIVSLLVFIFIYYNILLNKATADPQLETTRENWKSNLKREERKAMHYLLFYEYVEDYLTRRDAFRKTHLELAWQAQERGELVLAGVVDDPLDGAVFFFEADSPQVLESFVQADPYVQHGLVKHWRIRPWKTVVGDVATDPVRP